MRQTIPFVKDISFNSKIAEITSISLEHNLKMENNDSVVGTFTISGKYKVNKISINEEEFKKDINFDITLDDKYDFSELYKEYTKRFPLLNEERLLMFTILFIPWKITFTSSNFLDTKNIVRLCNYLFTTDKLFMENEAKNTKEQNHDIYKKQKNLEPNT